MGRRFLPDERCLGGVHEIHAEYTNMRRKLLSAEPEVGSYFYDALGSNLAEKTGKARRHGAQPSYAVAAADRLSSNRAYKLAASDEITLNHVRNIYHMHRRMDETDKRQFKAEVKSASDPRHFKRSNRETLAFSMTSWNPRQKGYSNCQALSRPLAANALKDPTVPLPSDGPYTPYQHLQATSATKQPPSRYHSQRLRSSYTAFKVAVLSEIIDKQLFEERQLRRLFRAYLTHNSLADMPVVRMVIADLQVEMDVKLSWSDRVNCCSTRQNFRHPIGNQSRPVDPANSGTALRTQRQLAGASIMSRKLLHQLPSVLEQSVRCAHTISFGKGVNYFPSLSKHGRPSKITQGSPTQRNVRSSMSDPDMFLNYTPTYAVSEVGKAAQLGGTATRRAFPDSVHIPEGGRPVATPDYPEPLRSSLTDADGKTLQRDMWPRKNAPTPTFPHRKSALPEPLQNSMADAEYAEVRPRQ